MFVSIGGGEVCVCVCICNSFCVYVCVCVAVFRIGEERKSVTLQCSFQG